MTLTDGDLAKKREAKRLKRVLLHRAIARANAPTSYRNLKVVGPTPCVSQDIPAPAPKRGSLWTRLTDAVMRRIGKVKATK